MGRKRSSELTKLQRRALECVRGARAEGLTLSAYCRRRRISVRQVYDTLASLRRRGMAGAGMSTAAGSKFVAVKISTPASSLPVRAALCRVMLAGGITVECAAWPPRAWLESLSTGSSHDSP